MRPWQADLGLLSIAITWGTTFPLVRECLTFMGPFWLVGLRYTAAGLLLAVIFPGRTLKLTRPELYYGFLLGLLLGCGNYLQTIGLQTVSAGKAGFITGLYIVVVPFLSWIFLRERLAWYKIVGTVVATIGLGLLSLDNQFNLQTGDLWVLASTVAYAGQIIGVALWGNGRDPIRMTIIQLVTVGIMGLVAAPFLETLALPDSPKFWGMFVYLTAIPTSLLFVIHLWLQPKSTPVRAALIFSTEAIWAALFGWGWNGEVMTAKEIAGSALMFFGIVLVEALPLLRRKP